MNDLTIKNDMADFKEMEMIMKYCEVIAQAPAYAAMGGMPGVFALVMSARELGIGPMAALNGGMFLIPPGIDKEGKPKGAPQIMMAARTMNMMILRAGHIIEEIENVPGKVVLKGTRKDTGVSMTATMTIDMAKQAGLSHDQYHKPKLWSSWFKNMEDMLWKTCISKLGRRLFADVIGNAYEEAEFSESDPSKVKPVAEIKSPKLQKQTETNRNLPNYSVDDFIKEYGLKGSNVALIDYVNSCASKMKKTWDETVDYCYKNKEGFLKAYGEFQEVQKKKALEIELLQAGESIPEEAL